MRRWILALLFLTSPALAHEWYDYDCCDNRDCYQLRDGSVKVTPMGYQLDYVSRDGFHVRRLINYGAAVVRTSQDQHYHACEAFVYKGDKIVDKFVRCLYVPGGDA